MRLEPMKLVSREASSQQLDAARGAAAGLLRSLPSWTPAGKLVHVGSLRAADKGCRGDSYEGHGLSVSECPAAWVEIASLGGEQ